MAEQHLYVYPSSTYTKTGAEYISDVQYLWTGGRSSIYSRALSLINNGQGIKSYAGGNWSDKNTWTWPGGGPWEKTWLSDDEKSTVSIKHNELVFNKTTWIDGTEDAPNVIKIRAANGDSFDATFRYSSQHNLLSDGVTYVGGQYSGGHTIEFNGLSGTQNEKSDDEIATEAVNWNSTVNYNEAGIRDEKINSVNSLNYKNSQYEFSYDVSNDYTQGEKNQVNPAHKKFDQSQMYLIKNGTQTFNSYHFLDKSSGFEFSFDQLTSNFDFVTNSASMSFRNIFLFDKGVEYKTEQLDLVMSGKEIDQINLGEEIGDPLGGINAHIKKIVLPVINKFSNEALKEDNLITVDENAKTSSVNAGAGNDTVGGGDGADKLAGGAGADDLTGGTGNDSLDGGTGDDVLYSGDGNDTVSGGDGADLIVGGDGAGNDSYDGGKGIDTVKYTSAKAGIRIDLTKGTAGSIASGDAAGIGSDRLKGIENIISGDFADVIIGGRDANVIEGRAGNDTIDGGLGNDTLIGGSGSDVFVFSNKPDSKNIDTIIDFEVGIDKIQLVSKVFKGIKPGADALASGLIVYDGASGTLSYDADGAGTKSKPIDIALIGKGLALTTADFIVV